MKHTFTDPIMIDSDENGILDKNEDPDYDSLNNYEKYINGSEPTNADIDEDELLERKFSLKGVICQKSKEKSSLNIEERENDENKNIH